MCDIFKNTTLKERIQINHIFGRAKQNNTAFF